MPRAALGTAYIQHGNDTIADASTTLVVTHDHGVTPTAVLLNPHTTNGELITVDAKSSTDFTVARGSSTGALDFDWVAIA